MKEKDYSEYELTAYDRYRMKREHRKDIILGYFHNKVRFDAEKRTIRFYVDDLNEDYSMDSFIDEYQDEQEKRRGVKLKDYPEDKELAAKRVKKNREQYALLQKKYEIERISSHGDPTDFSDYPTDENGNIDYDAEEPIRQPMNDVLSGTCVTIRYGEGILDFVYSDLITPMKERYAIYRLFRRIREKDDVDLPGAEPIEEEKPEKIYNRTQEIVEHYFQFCSTCDDLGDALYASLYSALFPPCFVGYDADTDRMMGRYADYLVTLQKEYQELLEFVYDENFHPEVLGNLYPSERYHLYRDIHDLSDSYTRREELMISHEHMGSPRRMPFGMEQEEYIKRIIKAFSSNETEAEKAFAEEYGLDVGHLTMMIRRPSFMSIQYDVSTAAEMLELEFTKMLEENIHFRKCKRCGRYFIMKGNYDTNYCDRIAEGSTRTCQELAAIENYRAKAAENKEYALYSKYYKRYSARVKVRQIKEADFKRWKYQALTKRDECAGGKITVEEYEAWLESSFPNRKKKN